MNIYKDYRHNPPHLYIPNAIYMITGSTIGKHSFFDTDLKMAYLLNTLQERASKMDWKVEAWAILSNHYHFIAKAPGDASTLSPLIRCIHSLSARYVNDLDKVPGRRIWHNYWDKCISSDKAYLVRLHYVNLNPVKHGLVEKPEDYSFSSYKYFMDDADTEFKREVFSQSIDGLDIEDDF
jgi:putative transposase